MFKRKKNDTPDQKFHSSLYFPDQNIWKRVGFIHDEMFGQKKMEKNVLFQTRHIEIQGWWTIPTKLLANIGASKFRKTEQLQIYFSAKFFWTWKTSKFRNAEQLQIYISAKFFRTRETAKKFVGFFMFIGWVRFEISKKKKKKKIGREIEMLAGVKPGIKEEED